MFGTDSYSIYVHCLTGNVSQFSYESSRKKSKDAKNLYGKKCRKILELILQECGLHNCSWMGLTVRNKKESGKIFLNMNLPVKTYISCFSKNKVMNVLLEAKFFFEDPFQITDKLSIFYYYLQIRENVQTLKKLADSDQVLVLFCLICSIELGPLDEYSLDHYLDLDLSLYLPTWMLELHSKAFILKSIQQVQSDSWGPISNRFRLMKRFITESHRVPELCTHFVQVKEALKTVSERSQTLLGLTSQYISIYNLDQNDQLNLRKSYRLDKLSKLKFKKRKLLIEIAHMPKKYKHPIEFEFESELECERFFDLCCQTCNYHMFARDIATTLRRGAYEDPNVPRELPTTKRSYRESLISGDEYDDNYELRGVKGLAQWRRYSEDLKSQAASSNQDSSTIENLDSTFTFSENSNNMDDSVFSVTSQNKISEEDLSKSFSNQEFKCSELAVDIQPSSREKNSETERRSRSNSLTSVITQEQEEKDSGFNTTQTFDVPFAIL
ncbi:tyrosine-protein phosphatase non-receptor type 13-like isoform X2 [Symsagittifera roscoffensis]|uniref:tyrosine-protein phosphatase non-receptor type 13-like isoform X2 n=1 Tax=Symsagittifera roscoffensis TaxID=84072 RepID=UPI00307B4BF4